LIEQIVANAAIRVRTGCSIAALHGDTALETVEVLESGPGTSTLDPMAAVFVMIGADAVTGWLPPEIARDSHGFILTGPEAAAAPTWAPRRRPFSLETSVPGIFAIGDVRSGSVKRVAAGVGEGGMSIAFTHQFLALDT
jgi:thioredoxin reductase (NADPH)